MINAAQFASVSEIAQKWHVSVRRVRLLCTTNRIPGAVQDDGCWFVPRLVNKPADKRATRYQTWPRELDRPIHNMEAAKARALLMAQTDGGFKPSRRNQERDDFIHEAAFHLHRDKEGSFSSDEVQEILHDRAIAGKSVREQIEVLHVKAAIAFILEKVQEQATLTISLIQQIHSLLSCGLPEGDTALDDEDSRPAVAALLDTFRHSREHLSQRLAAFMLAFLDLEPFAQRNLQTAAFTANFILLTNEYAPMIFPRYAVHPCLDDYLANGDTIRLARYIANANVEASRAWPSLILPKRK